jgi:tetratricopeptide (TPR) repeat protein
MSDMRVATRSAIALALFVSSAVADVDRGVELYRQDKYSEAEAELRRAVEQDDANARAHRYLGLALLRQERLDDASRHLTRADEIGPSGDTKAALAWLSIERKDFSKAEATLAEASGENLEFVRGLLRFYRKEHEAAAEDFETDLKNRPDHAYAHYYAGMAYSGMKRPDKMLTHFELFLRARPNAPEAKKVRAVLKTMG